MTKLVHFDSGFIDNSNYSINDDGTVVTGGLILVEGTHTDSKKKTHTFTKERLFKIADNSNALFESGAIIPVLDNHNKSTSSTLGTVESPFRIEVITQDNLPNKRAKHLIGKLGLFVDEVVIKAADAVEKVAKNIVKTVSPGLDLATETIREVSLTPQPAIVGMALYSESANNTALTFDELRNSDSQFDQIEEEYETLTDQLWTITKNIQMADDTAVPDEETRYELQMQAIETFVDEFINLIGLNQEEEDDSEQQDPRLMRQGNGANPNLNVNYGNELPLAAFSMADMEAIYAADELTTFGRGKDKRKRKSRSNLLRNVGIGLAGAGLIGAGIYAATRGKKVPSVTKPVGSTTVNSAKPTVPVTSTSNRLSPEQIAEVRRQANAPVKSYPYIQQYGESMNKTGKLFEDATRKDTMNYLSNRINRGYKQGSKRIVLGNQSPNAQRNVYDARRNRRNVEIASNAKSGDGFTPVPTKRIKRKR